MLAAWMRRLRFGNTCRAPAAVCRSAGAGRRGDAPGGVVPRASRGERPGGRSIGQSLDPRPAPLARDRRALRGESLVVVSNREPYLHQLGTAAPCSCDRPAAWSPPRPVLQACGGLWVAPWRRRYGPPDRRRVRVHPRAARRPAATRSSGSGSPRREEGYYYGFSNEGLWPLCHLARGAGLPLIGLGAIRSRPTKAFRRRGVGDRLEKAVVMVQDYQLALVPGLLRPLAPTFVSGLFNIPGPQRRAFRICPTGWNCSKAFSGRISSASTSSSTATTSSTRSIAWSRPEMDWDPLRRRDQGASLVRPFPISVQHWSERCRLEGTARGQIATSATTHQLTAAWWAWAWTASTTPKGIAERFHTCIERLFGSTPSTRAGSRSCSSEVPPRSHSALPRSRYRTGSDGRRDQLRLRTARAEADPLPGGPPRSPAGVRLLK